MIKHVAITRGYVESSENTWLILTPPEPVETEEELIQAVGNFIKEIIRHEEDIEAPVWLADQYGGGNDWEAIENLISDSFWGDVDFTAAAPDEIIVSVDVELRQGQRVQELHRYVLKETKPTLGEMRITDEVSVLIPFID